jgi:hypothetical protein
MNKPKLKLTRIMIEVLSSVNDNPENFSIEEIARESMEGAWSMHFEHISSNIIEGEDAIKAACAKQGTDIGFFESELEG